MIKIEKIILIILNFFFKKIQPTNIKVKKLGIFFVPCTLSY
jgi:hypothetical protein